MKNITPDDMVETQIDQWVEDKHQPLYDFCRPLPPTCQWCGYPFDASTPRQIKSIDCPIHKPAWWPHKDWELQLCAEYWAQEGD